MIAALRHREFRNLFIGLTLTNFGFWMQQFGIGWLVVQIAFRDGTPELAPFYLGLVSMGRAGPGIVLSLYSGVLADRIDRKLVLAWSNVAMGAVAFALAALTLTDHINIALLVLLGACGAAAGVFDQPTRQAMLPRLVPQKDILGAIGVNQSAVQIAGIVGPLLGGLLILPFGPGGLFMVKSAMHLVQGFLIAPIPPQPPEAQGPPQGTLSAILDGFRFLLAEPFLRVVLIGYALMSLGVRPIINLLPSVTANVMHVGAPELSWLFAVSAAGSLAGTVAITSLGAIPRQGLVLGGLWLASGVSLVAFALQDDFLRSLPALAIGSAVLLAAQGITVNLLQTRTPNHLLGRVMSVNQLYFNGFVPIGTMAIGSAAALSGVDTSLAVAGALVAVASVAIMAWSRRFRSFDVLHSVPTG